MAKQVLREQKETKNVSGLTLLLTGWACLAIGVGVGYYWAMHSTRPGQAPVAQGQTLGQTSVPDPAAFLQDESNLKAALAANPKDLNALVRLGNLYYDANRFKEATEWYGRALELDPQDVNVRTDCGTSYWNLGMADSAIAEFQQSLTVNPTHPQTLYNLGVVYLHGKNNPTEARKIWEKLLATNPNYPDRAKIEQELASLSGPAEAAPTNQQKSGSAEGVQDLLERLKKRP